MSAKLIKTRKLLKELVDKDRTIQMGRPVTDGSINESVKEMERIERRYVIYRDSFWIMTIISSTTALLTILSIIIK